MLSVGSELEYHLGKEARMGEMTGNRVDTGNLRVIGYPGNNMVLLAMSLDQSKLGAPGRELAGFAIFRSVSGKPEEPRLDR